MLFKWQNPLKIDEWSFQMMILADPSMEGRNTVVRHLMEVDSESPWPPDNHLEFTTLWCR